MDMVHGHTTAGADRDVYVYICVCVCLFDEHNIRGQGALIKGGEQNQKSNFTKTQSKSGYHKCKRN